MSQKILIVDDEAHLRLLLEQSLEQLEDQGAEILVASDGGEALRIIQRDHPAVVLLDVMMPVMNGFDVCKAIKRDPVLRSTYVLILTAKGQELDRITGAEVGADRYMTKPFDPDHVLEIVAEQLGMQV